MPSAEPATQTDRILFYDAICPFCVASLGKLRRLGLLERVEAVPLEEAGSRGLPPERVEGLRSEMLLWSRRTGETASGFEVILKLLEVHGRAPALRALGASRIGRTLGQAVYRLVSLNRRIITPAATRGIACECDPPYHAGSRAALFSILVLIAVGGSFLYGLALSTYQPDRPPATLGIRVILAAGAGWAVALAALFAAHPRRFRELFWQCLAGMAIGIAALAPFMIAAPILAVAGASPRACAWVQLIAVLASSALMLRSMLRRHRNLGFPQWTTWLWFAALEAGGLPLFVHWDLLGLRYVL